MLASQIRLRVRRDGIGAHRLDLGSTAMLPYALLDAAYTTRRTKWRWAASRNRSVPPTSKSWYAAGIPTLRGTFPMAA